MPIAVGVSVGVPFTQSEAFPFVPPAAFFLQMAGGAGYVLQTDGVSKIVI